MTRTVDIGEVLDIIDTMVAERGEAHTAPARYVDLETNRPDCGVGEVLCTLGVGAETLKTGKLFRQLTNEYLGLDLTLGARVVLDAFQKAQDGSGFVNGDRSWGHARNEAYKAAERFLELLPDSFFVAPPVVELVPA